MNLSLDSLSKKHGPLVRITPNTIMVSDFDALRHVFSVKAGYSKSVWFELAKWDLDRPSPLAMHNNDARRYRKAKLSPAFMGSGLTLMEQRVDRQLLTFVDLIERKYLSTRDGPRPIEFGRRSQFLILDMVTDVAFGETFGFMRTGSDVEQYVEMNETLLPMFGVLGTMSWLVHLMHSWPINKPMPGDGDKVGLGWLMRFAGEAVRKRLEPGYEKSNGFESENDVIRAFSTMDSTPRTSARAAHHPEVYRKLRVEIDAYYSEKHSEDIINYSDTKSLPYLQGVLRETMHLWPPSHYLPPKTEFGQFMDGLGRNQAIWGPDADVFRPERWLEAQQKKSGT